MDGQQVLCQIEGYDIADGQVLYSIRVGLANSSASWVVVRRFSDFESLLWALRPLGSPWSEYEVPPKRWFNQLEASFLEERLRRLQILLDSLARQPFPPAPMRQFLDVSGC